MPKYSLGLKSVKFGTPTGTSAMPETMESFAQTIRGSMTFSESEVTVKEFYVEEQDAAVEQTITESSKLEVTWKAYDLSSVFLKRVKGGPATESSENTKESWKAPSKTVLMKLALEVTSDSGAKYLIPRASIRGRLDGSVGREDMLSIEVKATALDPGDGEGPFSIEWPS
jgi:hypothetical protein